MNYFGLASHFQWLLDRSSESDHFYMYLWLNCSVSRLLNFVLVKLKYLSLLSMHCALLAIDPWRVGASVTSLQLFFDDVYHSFKSHFRIHCLCSVIVKYLLNKWSNFTLFCMNLIQWVPFSLRVTWVNLSAAWRFSNLLSIHKAGWEIAWLLQFLFH